MEKNALKYKNTAIQRIVRIIVPPKKHIAYIYLKKKET